MRRFPKRFEPVRIPVMTLLIDGKKMTIGTRRAFSNIIDLHGITMNVATMDDIIKLPIHPATETRVKQILHQVIAQHCPGAAQHQQPDPAPRKTKTAIILDLQPQ